MRKATTILTGISLLAVVGWLYTRRQELVGIQWGEQWRLLFVLVVMYGFSAIVNFVVWHMRVIKITRINWQRDLYLYAYSSLSRRLPSGLGYFIVRAVRYPTEGLNVSTVMTLSVYELVFQVMSGIGIAAGIALLMSGHVQSIHVLLIISAGVLFLVLARTSFASVFSRLICDHKPCLLHAALHATLNYRVWFWYMLYSLSWINGGLMLYVLLTGVSGINSISFWSVLGLWTLSGSLGLIGGVLPIGQFARDTTLSVLLLPYMPLSAAILAALIFRLVLTIGDVLWSLALMGASSLIAHKRYCSKG